MTRMAMTDFLVKNVMKAMLEGDCQGNIESHLVAFVKLFREKFQEDNRATQDAFLRECLENALAKTADTPTFFC